MQNKASAIGPMLAASLFVVACPLFAASNVLHIGEADAGKTKIARRGDKVELALPGGLSTGFSWKVSSIEGKSIKQAGDVEYKATTPVMPGSPGIFVARFKAVSTGSSTINMQYLRPWEKNTPPARTFSVTVDVK